MTTQRELPLFPLNTVLFPGMHLPLHIFETRYKILIEECVRDSHAFGVVLIRSGSEVSGGAEIHEVGTTAHITRVKRLDNGEMDIVTLGKDRFRVVGTHQRSPYLTGFVEDFPVLRPNDPCIPRVSREVGALVEKYLGIVARLGKVELKLRPLPGDPMTLAFLAAALLHMPMADKQKLLNLPELAGILEAERQMLRRESLLLNYLIETGPRWRDESDTSGQN